MSLLRLLADFTLEGPQEDECREFFERGLLMTLLATVPRTLGTCPGLNPGAGSISKSQERRFT